MSHIFKIKRGWVFAIVSSALHLAWAFSLRGLKVEPPHRETTVEFSLVAQPAPAAPEPQPIAPPPTAAAPLEPAAKRPLQPRRPSAQPAPAEQPAAADPVVPEAPAAPAVAGQVTVPAPSPAQPQPAPDLSPRRAAVASYDTLSNPPSSCNPPAANGGVCPPRPRDAPAQDRLNQWLRQSARSPEHLVKREPPVLHRQADGSFRFEGHVFTAKIEPDGHVRFADGSVASIDGPATKRT